MADATPPDAGVPVNSTVPGPPRRLRRQHQRGRSGAGPSGVVPLVFDGTEAQPAPPRLDLFKASLGPLRWAEMAERSHTHSGEVSDTLDRVLVEHDAEATLKCMQKEMHEERLKQLRQLQTSIADDDWRYTPVEKLIGLQ